MRMVSLEREALRETPGAFVASSRLDRVPPAALDAKYACHVVNRSDTRLHTFLGDLAASAEGSRSQELLKWRSLSVMEVYYPPKDANENAQTISTAKKQEGRWKWVAIWLRILTIILAIGALVAFISGAFNGWQLFSQTP